MNKYGKTEVEKDIEEISKCRLIVKEIIDYGVTEDQKKQIIKLLSLELEDVSTMKKIAAILNNNEVSSDKKLIYIE
tara:strand:- start:201 stop:428 length:228 start_codon:yes stop_codon:yes gene_type:complete